MRIITECDCPDNLRGAYALSLQTAQGLRALDLRQRDAAPVRGRMLIRCVPAFTKMLAKYRKM